MAICFTLPEIFIPNENISINQQSELLGFYRDTYDILNENEFRGKKESYNVPCAEKLTSEELILESAKKVIGKYDFLKGNISYLIDCRSSAALSSPAPTYKLASALDLNSIQTLSIHGLFGTELLYAFNLIESYLEKDQVSILTFAQRFQPDDSRSINNSNCFLADASACILVSNAPNKIKSGLLVEEIYIEKKVEEIIFDINKTEQDLNFKLNNKNNNINNGYWIISHNTDKKESQEMEKLFSPSFYYTREQVGKYDFGCVDLLVSLSFALAKIKKIIESKPGILIFKGRYGSIGAIKVKYFEEEKSYGQTRIKW